MFNLITTRMLAWGLLIIALILVIYAYTQTGIEMTALMVGGLIVGAAGLAMKYTETGKEVEESIERQLPFFSVDEESVEYAQKDE